MLNQFDTASRNLAVQRNVTFGMPPDALGLWFMDRYSAAQRCTPNALDATPPSKNLFRASRRLFSRTDLWSALNCTISDASVTAPDGTSDASTINGAGGANWYIGSSDGTNLPAGTYTIAANVKRNTGSDQSWAFTGDNGSTKSSTNLATSSWQRFSYTFTLGSPAAISRVKIISYDGTTGANLQVCDLELYAGSADLGPATPNSHIYWGVSGVTAAPTYAAGAIDLSGGGVGLLQLPVARSISRATIVAVISKVSSGSSHFGFLSKIQSYSTFTAYAELSSVPEFYFSTTTAKAQTAGLWPMLSQGFHALTLRQSGSSTDVFLNNIRVSTNSGTPSAVSIQDFYLGFVNTSSLPAKHKIAALALYGRALTDAEVRQAVTTLRGRVGLSGLSLLAPRSYHAEGDSITGANSYCFPYVFGGNASPVVQGTNWGISGSTLANLNSRAANVDASIPPNKGSTNCILSILIGANDLATYTGAAAQYITDLRAYCAARRSAGWTVVICTILPIDGNATHNSRRATVNTDITTNFVSGGYADAVADFAADAVMGPDNSRTLDATKWTDATHPNADGHVILEGIIRTVINSL